MKTVQAMLAEAEAVVPRISPEEAKGLLGRTDVLFLDVREPAEVAASGKVPGALAVPRGLVEFRADPASAAARRGVRSRQDGGCLLRVRWTLSPGRQDPQGDGIRQRAKPWRLQGLAGCRRRGRKGIIDAPSHAAVIRRDRNELLRRVRSAKGRPYASASRCRARINSDTMMAMLSAFQPSPFRNAAA